MLACLQLLSLILNTIEIVFLPHCWFLWWYPIALSKNTVKKKAKTKRKHVFSLVLLTCHMQCAALWSLWAITLMIAYLHYWCVWWHILWIVTLVATYIYINDVHCDIYCGLFVIVIWQFKKIIFRYINYAQLPNLVWLCNCFINSQSRHSYIPPDRRILKIPIHVRNLRKSISKFDTEMEIDILSMTAVVHTVICAVTL